MKKNGFIMSTYVYILLVFFLLLLGTMLVVLNNTRLLANKIKENTDGNIDFNLVLKGDKEIFIVKDSEYIEPGCIATTFDGGKLEVSVMGEVNPKKSGEYDIEYSAEYKGVEKKVKRKVIVGENLVTYITNLYEDSITRASNNLKKDNTEDKNIRYYGANPNNYVRFNNELWRIIGVFGENIKLVRKDSLGVLSWDVSDGVNNNWGVNQWGESTYEDGNNYVGSSLYRYLNELYYGGNQVNCWRINYEKNVFQTVECPKDDDGNFLKLDDTAKSLIDNYTWNVGAIEGNTREDTLAFYQAERGTKIGKICSGGKVCNDTVVRTTEWTGYVGLPYPTDYSYASENKTCETNMNIRNSSNGGVCGENNWLHRKTKTWYLSPFADSTHADMTWFVLNDGVVGAQSAGYSNDVIPSIYLKSNVQIISGAGTSDNPYVLKLG